MTDDRDASYVVRPTIPARYLLEMAARVPGGPGTLRRALARARLAPGALRIPGFRASVAQLELYYRALVREGGDELFGWFARPVPRGTYATLVRVLTACRDVGASVDASSCFYRLFDPHPYWQLDVDRRSATLTVVPRDGPQARAAFFVHSMLLTPVRTASWLAAHPLPLDEVRLAPRFRSLRAETRFLFGCEPRFAEGPPRIVFPAELARLPVVRRPDEVGEYARTSLRRMLLAAPAETLHARLRALLSSTTPVAAADIGETSRRLGVSRATLARRLAREGTSFQALKDDVRRDHAIALLTGSPLPLGEIAERLGYSAQSAFQRAFRDWTGVSPGRFRAR